ncbi:energy transducer TonB [Allosphingosinicella flava]|uniref:Protein TonB n=1 Tax=Allosphingosinicella flava TaxID=2771430 RepID=A0A7T2LLA3_9SPHN|nr:energy transducer TonB [Sphingosinicella flava]QPQ54310.1 energy transducer TonB [Sphingosinicella flava]
MIETATQDRVKSALVAGAVHALLAYAFIAGLDRHAAPALDPPLKLFDISLPVPPPVVETVQPESRRMPEPEGRAAPPGLKAEASPIVAPKPRVRLDPPPPVVAAPVPGIGASVSQGASDVPGPGTGAGGTGTGTGSGGAGSGTGGGGAAARARQIAGRIVNADYPRAAKRAGVEGEVLVRFTVEPDGRVGRCSVVRSSGSDALDSTTCRLIQQRYRFAPARDASGRPVSDEKGWVQRWWLERD